MRRRYVFGNRWTVGPTTALAAILLAFLALSSIVAVKTPAWESADEPGHTYNIEQLASGHWYRIPVPPPHRLEYTNELHQPPLYYLIMAGVQRAIGEPVHSTNPGPSAFPFVTRGWYAHHSPSQHHFLWSLRLPNLAFGLIAIIFTFLTARVLTDDRWTPVVAAAICGLLPRLIFLSAGVTNDNLVTALGAVLAYCAVRSVSPASTARVAALGVVSGLMVLAKLTALPALAVLAVVVVFQDSLRRRLRTAFIVGLLLVLTCGWYLVRDQVLYGDPFALGATHRYLVGIFGLGTTTKTGLGATIGTYVVNDPLSLIFSAVPQRIFSGFWYQSDWNQFRWPTQTSAVYWLALLAALLGFRRSRATRQTPSRRRAQIVALIVLAAAGFATVWIAAFSTSAYEPRLGFYGVPALACLAALGLERWRLPVRLVLPAMELIGSAIAIQQNVLAVHWY